MTNVQWLVRELYDYGFTTSEVNDFLSTIYGALTLNQNIESKIAYNHSEKFIDAFYLFCEEIYTLTDQDLLELVGYSTGIPFKTDALVWLDGDILLNGSDYYFADKSGYARNFLITSYDFNSDWDKGFPYKTAATISAPAGDTALIAADINNFLYASNGTPNQIPVISLFQDIDYEHKLFCRHSAQVLDSNGVETYEPRVLDIVLYNTVKSGNDLVTCQSYYSVPTESGTAKWVSPSGNDTTGTGTKANPYLTVFKAYSVVADGSTIYVKSNSTCGEYNNTTLRYYYMDRVGTWTIKSLGFNTIKAISTSFVLRAVAGTVNFYNFIIDGQSTTQYTVNFYYPNVNTIILNKCMVKGYTGMAVFSDTSHDGLVNTFEAYDCVFPTNVNNAINIQLSDPSKIYRSYIVGCTYFKTTGEYYYNKFNNTTLYNTYPAVYGGTSIKYNKITTKSMGIRCVGSGSTDIYYNNFNFVWTGTTGQVNYLIYSDQDGWIPTIKNNNLICHSLNITDYVYLVYLGKCTTPEISNNIFISDSKSNVGHIDIEATSVVVGKCKINNNVFKCNTNTGNISIIVSLGGETGLANKFDESELIGNHFIGSLYDYPNEAVGSTHFALMNGGINFDIRNNKVTYTGLGIVVKSGIAQSYTKNGVGYNIFFNNKIDIWVRGVKDLLIYNNSLNYNGGISGITDSVRIQIDENAANPGNYCENVLLKNNIINHNYSEANTYSLYFDQHAADNGCQYINNIINNTDSVNRLLRVGTGSTYYTSISALESAGLGSGNLETNPLFSDIINNILTLQSNSPALNTGLNLGTNYNSGLDVSSDWGSSTQMPVIVTKQQGANWNIGAYVQ